MSRREVTATEAERPWPSAAQRAAFISDNRHAHPALHHDITKGIGKTTKAPLASHRTNAMGCSERAEARKLMSDEYKAMLDN